MSRFALFTFVLLVLVAIGSEPRHGKTTLESLCVCVPSKAGLIVKAAVAKTQARLQSGRVICPKGAITE